MSLPVIVRPAAKADIAEIYELLEQSRRGVGRKFMARFRTLVELIEAMPEMFGVIW